MEHGVIGRSNEMTKFSFRMSCVLSSKRAFLSFGKKRRFPLVEKYFHFDMFLCEEHHSRDIFAHYRADPLSDLVDMIRLVRNYLFASPIRFAKRLEMNDNGYPP
ncbi:hypothetical protein BLOT_005855 [Blomia tropicalis]|nr:hypothetical protein BLOT_005855 [Blomia tropicalis]